MESSAVSTWPIVLLVEPEPLVGETIAAFLDEAGFKVLVARRPAEAFNVCARLERLDAMVADIGSRTGMSSTELARRLVARWPDLAIVYVAASMSERASVPPDAKLLMKPVRLSRLADELTSMLVGRIAVDDTGALPSPSATGELHRPGESALPASKPDKS
jgi:DNA-binding response OmpR family regulator